MARPKRLSDTPKETSQAERLYQKLARELFADLAAGRYAVGDRLPAERELSVQYNVSRPAVREAMIALEVQGLIEVRIGSGAYVRALPGEADSPGFDVTAFELMEARLLVEGEAAALAAVHIADDELGELERLVDAMEDENRLPGVSTNADYAFHMLIATATRNAVIRSQVEEMWHLRSTSPNCALLLGKARTANVQPVVEEHRAVLEALRAHDSAAARAAMRHHMSSVIDHLLFATEAEAVEAARRDVATTRARYARAASL
ncbi:FadR/GntR family transcriptional regulator [Sphingobium algorifonticola]|uniref:FadR family transcriptional regulator n=1 Tax=Sphingobium algorifonticola TaxID=2008318 RepID=A0A437J478_9SPHN|nr:FCD domain-containing protein [Sphingobium algorifonticola]RVT39420.1 FadR family transcriptional regulator [Sphingobium algorifonticola]